MKSTNHIITESHCKIVYVTRVTDFGMFVSGLLMYSMVISDIIERFTEADTVIMGDVSINNNFRNELQYFRREKSESNNKILAFIVRIYRLHMVLAVSMITQQKRWVPICWFIMVTVV